MAKSADNAQLIYMYSATVWTAFAHSNKPTIDTELNSEHLVFDFDLMKTRRRTEHIKCKGEISRR